MPIDDAQAGNRSLADVFVDHVRLLHPVLRTRVDAVLDLDDQGRARADMVRIPLRGHFDDGGEREFPGRRERIFFGVHRGLRNRELVGMAVTEF